MCTSTCVQLVGGVATTPHGHVAPIALRLRGARVRSVAAEACASQKIAPLLRGRHRSAAAATGGLHSTTVRCSAFGLTLSVVTTSASAPAPSTVGIHQGSKRPAGELGRRTGLCDVRSALGEEQRGGASSREAGDGGRWAWGVSREAPSPFVKRFGARRRAVSCVGASR